MDALQSISSLSAFSTPIIGVAMAVFARISGLVFFLPGLAEQMTPVRVKLGAAMAIAMVVTPAVFTSAAFPQTLSAAAMMIAAEAVVGAFLGFTIRVTIYALQTAGAITSQSLSLAQLFGASVDLQPETPISTLLMIAAVTIAVISGLHFEIIRILIKTFEVFPLGVFPGAGETGEWAVERVAFSFAAALSMALPFVALGFVYNMAIGAANRAMPQLMVAFVGIPAVTMAGLVLLAMSAPIILGVWADILDDTLLTLMAM